jgi:hypothetical protein
MMNLNRVAQHFENLRKSLCSLYDQSKAASHTVVTGSLREGFIRAVLQGHLPSTASWSTGQIIGHAPDAEASGQLDIILHSGELPQIFIHDRYIRLVPSDACIGIVEVKSEITTGKITNPTPTDVMSGALESLMKAKKVARKIGGANQSNVPFHIIAFSTKVSAQKVMDFTYDFLETKNLSHREFWPDSIVVLKGAKTEPEGYGLFRGDVPVRFPQGSEQQQLKNAVDNLEVNKVLGWKSLAVLVSLLANQAAEFPSEKFRFENYVYE